MALLAQVIADPGSIEARGAARRELRLEVDAASASGASRAIIHNLSERGLLVETAAEGFAVDKTVELVLPGSGHVQARVVWSRGEFFGCEFEAPVAKAVVSAALLRSPARVPPPPAAVLQMLYGHARHRDEAPEQVSSWLVIASLILGLVTVGCFVLALLTLDFSVQF